MGDCTCDGRCEGKGCMCVKIEPDGRCSCYCGPPRVVTMARGRGAKLQLDAVVTLCARRATVLDFARLVERTTNRRVLVPASIAGDRLPRTQTGSLHRLIRAASLVLEKS
jgi:hypothetical protein